MSHIFISYSHLDRTYAEGLADALKDEFSVWIDHRVDYGDTWPHVIQENLDKASAVIVVMTPRAYESEWVQCELSRAKRKRKLIFPLLLEGEPWLSVEATQYVDVTDGRMPPSDFRNRLKMALGPADASDSAAAVQVSNLKKKQARSSLRSRKVNEVLNAFDRAIRQGERWGVGLHEVYAITITSGIYLYAEVKDLERLALYAPKVNEEYTLYRRDEQIKAARQKVLLARKTDPSGPDVMTEHFLNVTVPNNNLMGKIDYLRNLGIRLLWYPKTLTEDLTPMAKEILEVNATLGLPLELTIVSMIGTEG